MQPNQDTKAGTIGGLLFALLGLSEGEMVKAALLAAIGATVSYSVTVGIRWVVKYIKRRFAEK